MRYLKLGEILQLHTRIIEQSGGADGILDLGLLESALGQSQISFGGKEVYPSLADKAAALCFSIIQNHPFVDGNKRNGHAAMEVFLILNGYELDADADDTERILLSLASREIERDQFTSWVQTHLKAL
ncbi:MAG: type II toxin-antitoxin system death-on-curing family toxin [Desulfomonilaceae bacterium]